MIVPKNCSTNPPSNGMRAHLTHLSAIYPPVFVLSEICVLIAVAEPRNLFDSIFRRCWCYDLGTGALFLHLLTPFGLLNLYIDMNDARRSDVFFCWRTVVLPIPGCLLIPTHVGWMHILLTDRSVSHPGCLFIPTHVGWMQFCRRTVVLAIRAVWHFYVPIFPLVLLQTEPPRCLAWLNSTVRDKYNLDKWSPLI